MGDHIDVTRDDAVVRVDLNRPDKRNAFDGQTLSELVDVFEALSSDTETRVIVFGGKGPVFCAGADLGWMRKMAMAPGDDNQEGARRMAGLFGLVDRCRKPIIGRIQGAALGGGTGLVAACDIPITTADTRFGFSEVRLGLAPAVISPYVVRRIGTAWARELFVTGSRFDGNHAHHIGLVHHVVEDEAALDRAVQSTVKSILQGAPGASIACKELARTVTSLEPDDAFDTTAALIAELRASAEGQEGTLAFLQRRKPSWCPPDETDL